MIPALLFGGIGAIALFQVAARNLEITMGATGVLILLVLLPFAFTSMSRLRNDRNLRKLIELNRARP